MESFKHESYKGFDLFSKNGRFYVCDGMFKDQGYATESAAKVAITKYLKQQEQAAKSSEWTEEDQREQDYFDRWPVENNFTNPPSANNPEDFIDWLEESVNTINKIAERVYSTPVQQSRNKREGYFCGITDCRVVRLKGFKKVVNTNYEPKNRKQRKAAKLKNKNYVSAGQLWNDYMCVGVEYAN